MVESRTTATQTFGNFFRSKRLEQGLTLRTFCEKYGYDPGNISRLERGLTAPSTDKEKLTGYAAALKIPEGSPEWTLFFDLAYSAKGAIPPDIKNDPEALILLPAFYRTARGEKLDREKLEKLIELLFKNPAENE